eukprot:6174884-Pleurochrysis_carterae.AAC.1
MYAPMPPSGKCIAAPKIFEGVNAPKTMTSEGQQGPYDHRNTFPEFAFAEAPVGATEQQRSSTVVHRSRRSCQ